MFARRPRSGPRRGGSRRAESAVRPAQRVKQLLLSWIERCLRRVHEPHALKRRALPASGIAAAARRAPLVQLMREELAGLLDRHARSRHTLRHLALLERMLVERGEAAVWALPDHVLERALTQLEALTDDWSQPGLAELHARLLTTVRPHDAAAARPHDNMLSTFGTPDKLQVSEVGLSVFEELDASWVSGKAQDKR